MVTPRYPRDPGARRDLESPAHTCWTQGALRPVEEEPGGKGTARWARPGPAEDAPEITAGLGGIR